MNITRIQLTNFRNHAHAVISIDPSTGRLVYLVGRNHTGKSSILDGVLFALTGRCRGTDAAGRGADLLVRSGASQGEVVVDLVRGQGEACRVARTFGSKAGVTFTAHGAEESGEILTGSAARDEIAAWVGGADVIEGLADGVSAILTAEHTVAKALLLRALRVSVPVRGLDLSPLGVEAATATVSLDSATRLYDRAYALRADVKRRKVPVSSTPPCLEPDASTRQRLADEVAALRAEALTAAREEGEARAAAREGERQRAEVVRRLRVQAEAVAKHVETLGALYGRIATVLGQDEWPARPTADELRRAADSLAPLVGGPDPRMALIELADAKARRDVVASRPSPREHNPKAGCVLSPAIRCDTPAKFFKAASDEHAAAVREAEREVATRQAYYDEQLKSAEAATSARALRRDALAAADQWDDLGREGDDLVALLATLDAAPAEAPPGPSTVERINEQIALVDVDLAHYAEQAARYATWRRDRDAAVALDAEIAALETLVAELGPKGRPSQALGHALDRWLSDVNARMPGGYTLAFTLDPWRVLVNDRPAALLSKSERLRVGCALQCAIARVTGIGFVLLDEFDMLDTVERAAATEDLLTFVEAGGQVIVAATRDDVPPSNPQLGVHVIDVAALSSAPLTGSIAGRQTRRAKA